MRKAKEHGITDFRSPEAPQNMFEAVKRFFPQVVDGKISNLSPKQRTDLAEQCLLVGVKRAARVNSIYPTYTLVDFGEGQKPADFPKTFLSLSEKNKEGISFVQGKFNMGSTGSLRFCTRSDIRLGHYKLIISKRHDYDYWGWTLIRVRELRLENNYPSPNILQMAESRASVVMQCQLLDMKLWGKSRQELSLNCMSLMLVRVPLPSISACETHLM